MADFSFVSDSSDEGAVEELLNQAMDHSILQQVAAINCSSFSSDSVLPSHLESRFGKLKSFPPTIPISSSSSSSSSQFHSVKSFNPQSQNSVDKGNPMSHSLGDEQNEFSKAGPNERKNLKPKFGSGSGSSPSKSTNSSRGETGSKPKSRSGSFSSPSNSSNLSMVSLSPPKKTGCFWCSPKKVSSKKSKENPVIGVGDGWGKNSEEFLADLKVQQKMLKKAMKEEEKINREAEKIVKWAKQASARMVISDLEDDELSHYDDPK